jgi:hypothetical protein
MKLPSSILSLLFLIACAGGERGVCICAVPVEVLVAVPVPVPVIMGRRGFRRESLATLPPSPQPTNPAETALLPQLSSEQFLYFKFNITSRLPI